MKRFLLGAATYQVPKTAHVMLAEHVSILMVPSSPLSYNLIWMLDHMATLFMKELWLMAQQVSVSPSFLRKSHEGPQKGKLNETFLCCLTVWLHGGFGGCPPHLVCVHGRDEEGEGNGGGRHGVGRRHPIFRHHSLLESHDGRGEGAGPL